MSPQLSKVFSVPTACAAPDCGSPNLRAAAAELSGSAAQQLSLVAAVHHLWGGPAPPQEAARAAAAAVEEEAGAGSGDSSPTSWDSEHRATIQCFLECGKHLL